MLRTVSICSRRIASKGVAFSSRNACRRAPRVAASSEETAAAAEELAAQPETLKAIVESLTARACGGGLSTSRAGSGGSPMAPATVR